MNKKYNGSFKQLLFITIFSSVLFVSIISIFVQKDKNIPEETFTNKVSIKDIGYGFLYYDGNVYYKNPNLIIYDLSQVGEPIGTNEKHIMKDDVTDNCIKINEEKLCVYAEPLGSTIYSYKLRDDVLLLESDYAVNQYFVYIRNKTFEDLADYYSLKYFIDNPDKVDKYSLISYGMQEIDINYSLEDFKHDENNTFSFYSSSVYDGAMKYYLLIKTDNLYSVFEGEGNLLSDVIIINSNEEGRTIQYMYKCEGLKEVLINMYSDYFEINEKMKEQLLNPSMEETKPEYNIKQEENIENNNFDKPELSKAPVTQNDLTPLN